METDSDMFRQQAAYCAQLLSKKLEPRRRAQLEKEREDWLLLAHEQETWLAVQAEERIRPRSN
jgi:hypothetical protein